MEIREKIESALVEMILGLRSDYLRAGANPMDHWTQLESRCRAAAMQCETISEWCSAVQRRLQIPSLSKGSSASLIALNSVCESDEAIDDALDMVSRDYGLLIALARNVVDEAKEAKASALDRKKLEETAAKYGLMEEK